MEATMAASESRNGRRTTRRPRSGAGASSRLPAVRILYWSSAQIRPSRPEVVTSVPRRGSAFGSRGAKAANRRSLSGWVFSESSACSCRLPPQHPLHAHALAQSTVGSSCPLPPHAAPQAPLPQCSSVSRHAVGPCPQSSSHVAAVPQSMIANSQLSVWSAQVTLHANSGGHWIVASSHASDPSHCTSHEKPGGQTRFAPTHSVGPQWMMQFELFGPLHEVHAAGHSPPGGTGAAPQSPPPTAPPVPPIAPVDPP